MRPSWLPLAEPSGSTKEKKPVMDPVTSTTGSKWRVNKKKRGLHKPLHGRKTSAQPPAMHSADKHGPKKIGGVWEQLAALQASPEKPPQEAQRRAADGENTLRFKCSQCWDGLEYVPKDLVRHVEEEHKGNLPVFSCQTCSFSTHQFSYLQVHLLSHKDTFSSCTVCNDNVQRTWPEFSAHLTTRHRQNDKYSCEMCQTFSTGDVGEFLEHVCAHNLGLESANEDLPLYARDKRRFGTKATAQTLHCQLCGYKASQKLLISKHIKAVHVCPNGNRRKTINEIKAMAVEPDDPIPEMTTRLTRSAVREMCWLTQDCLSLPGTEFLDKYCHLSDPQTTLEETQQFLMKSVAVETGGQKWSKALKSVLSNVPTDMNHVLKPDGITSDGSDLTVLTVKNKITVAQNGAPYAKKLRIMTSSEKESAADDACCGVDQNGCQSNLCDRVTCPLPELKPDDDASFPAQNDLSAGPRMQDDRENQEVRSDQEVEAHAHEDGFELSSELKLTNESEEQMPPHKIAPKSKRRNRRRKRRPRRAEKRSAGLPLKIVLKKNPVKEKQWVSQSAPSPSGGGLADDVTCRGLPSPRATVQKMAHILQDMLLTEAQQENRTKASRPGLDGPPQAIAPAPLRPGGGNPGVSDPKTIDRNVIQSAASPWRDDTEKPLQLLETEVCTSSSAVGAKAGVFPDSRPPLTSDGGMDCQVSEMTSAGGAAPHCEASPDDHNVITPEGRRSSEDLTLTLFSDPPAEGMSGTQLPADPRPDLLNCPAVTVIPPEPSPPSGQWWQPPPKTRERTLKLVAINPNQLVKRPAGDQPVVVLNHPDADTPEVARIMEVVSRYRGEVQKVVLSHRTATTLSATKGRGPETNKPADARPGSLGPGSTSVQERFLLRLKLRRLSRKKYEVVDMAPPSRDPKTRFRCWFCGRVFTSQEAWVVHRQRHLMEWK